MSVCVCVCAVVTFTAHGGSFCSFLSHSAVQISLTEAGSLPRGAHFQLPIAIKTKLSSNATSGVNLHLLQILTLNGKVGACLLSHYHLQWLLLRASGTPEWLV